jgi:hypothetical protein
MTDMHFSREVTLFFWANTGLLLGYGERLAQGKSAQLKSTVAALRNALEAARTDAADATAASERAFRAEREQLLEMIWALRARLEAADVG